MRIYRTPSRTVFEVFNYACFALLCVSILVPFLNAIAISLSSYDELIKGGIGIWPKGFNMRAYETLTDNRLFIRTFFNTVGFTVVTTVLVIALSLSSAYALSYKALPGRSLVFIYILITMFFSGGLIPTYLLVTQLGLNNHYLAIILPNITNVFYIIVFKNIIEQLPQELLESAKIDGANEWRVLFHIVMPLIIPMTTAFTIFSAVAYWNEWFNVMLYIRDSSKWTLQYMLRDIIANTAPDMADKDNIGMNAFKKVHPENIKMAALMLTVLPIIVIYPFLQKYFIHGALVGAVKG